MKGYCKTKVFLYKLLFSNNKPFLNNVNVVQGTQFVGKGTISINNSQLGVWPSPGIVCGAGYIEARMNGAEVVIEHSTFINNNFVFIADRTSIKIGKRCLIGPNFFITDSDFHGLNVKDRLNGNYECFPTVIEDDVFIGEGVKVMKGVTIGRGSVIGSGSVVVNDIDPNSIYAGVPAKKIRNLNG